MYTTEELHVTGIVTAMTTPDVVSGQPGGSEFEESNITDFEGTPDMVEESTDMEMVWQTHTTLMITSNREKLRLEALAKEQDRAVTEAVRQVQEHHLDEVQAIVNDACHREEGHSTHKCCSASHEDDVKGSREESPKASTRPQERGRSLHCKSKSDLQFRALPGKRHLGSKSFTPSRPHSHSRSSTPSRSQCRDSTPHTSRKRLVARVLRPMEVTPTQSLAQKTPKLKSLVQRVPAAKSYWDPPYKSLETDPREFIRYLIRTLDHKVYDAKIRCLAIFSCQSTVLAHHVILSTITTLVAANRGVHFLTPFIPMELMSMLANPTDAEPPGPPVHSNDYQMDVRVKWRREWIYLMRLLQYWHDASTVYTYGESKLMLYVFYRINAMLNPYSIYIWLLEVMDNTPWLHNYQESTQPADRIVDYESHLHIIKGLEILCNWLWNRYLVEAMVEWRHLTLHSDALDKIPYPRSYEDQ